MGSLQGVGVMRASMLATLATVLLMVGPTVAQDTVAQAKDKSGSSGANADSAGPSKTLAVSGKVSNDGKTLLTDIDSEWAVSNPEALKGQEGRLVTVKCYVDTENNRIHVLSVKGAVPHPTSSIRYGDSALRR